MEKTMRMFGIRTMLFVVALTLCGRAAEAAVAERLSGYKTLTDCRLEFSAEAAADHLSAQITVLELTGGSTKADVPSVLMRMAEYGDVVVESFDGSALASCAATLQELALPSTVTNLAAGVFSSCTALTKVTFNGAPPEGLAAAGLALGVTLYYDASGDNGTAWEALIATCGFTDTHALGAQAIADLDELAEVFEGYPEVTNGIGSVAKLGDFNAFLADVGVSSGSDLTAAQKAHAYASFALSSVMENPTLFVQTPQLTIDDFSPTNGCWALTVSLAGASDTTMVAAALAEAIRVGTSVNGITNAPTLVSIPSKNASTLTFEIDSGSASPFFVKVVVTK